MPEAGTVLYLSSAQTRVACEDLDPVATVREALAAYADGPDRSAVRAYHSGVLVRGRPEHRAGPGLALLFDATAGISCLIAADYLTALSTASVTVAVADRLAASGVMMVGVLGADPLVELFAEVLAASRPGLVHIALYDPDSTSAHALGDRMAEPLRRHGVGVSVASSGRDAALGANLVVTATATASGQARYEWLHRGAVLVNLSHGDLSSEIVRRCDILLVDDWAHASAEPTCLLGTMSRGGELIGPGDDPLPPSGAVRQVDAEVGDVIGGRHPGRTRHDEVIVVHLAGVDVTDVALAHQVHRVATRRGLGVRLPW
jgi:ornithine cyclodeaminase/alanine dehydrogenase-like protein (mu-crystallin family)